MTFGPGADTGSKPAGLGTVPEISILGAGKAGIAIARALSDAGLVVQVATSKAPEDIALMLEVMAPGATAVILGEALAAEVVILAIPLHRHREIAAKGLAGSVVVDAMNYWPAIDGIMPEFEDPLRSSSEIVQRHFEGASLVKALNHIGYHELEAGALLAGTPGRLAAAIASDDPDAAEEVSTLIDLIGYDPVPIGSLAMSRIVEPGGFAFGRPITRLDLVGALAPQLNTRNVQQCS